MQQVDRPVIQEQGRWKVNLSINSFGTISSTTSTAKGESQSITLLSVRSKIPACFSASPALENCILCIQGLLFCFMHGMGHLLSLDARTRKVWTKEKEKEENPCKDQNRWGRCTWGWRQQQSNCILNRLIDIKSKSRISVQKSTPFTYKHQCLCLPGVVFYTVRHPGCS